jgi:small subunit ribosomal protein S6
MEERLYDLVFICLPATPEEEIAKIIATLEHAITEHGGKVEKVEKWGTRKMAYRVAKQREGSYVYLSMRTSHGEVIKELERRLKVSDTVIKYMTVRLDEEIKRQQKLVGRRERRARRRPSKSPAAAPMAAPEAAPAPSQVAQAETPAAAATSGESQAKEA